MQKQSKSLLIAIAAFAVTTSGVSAYGGTNVINRANLSDDQRAAIQQAKELRSEGDLEGARDLLVEAGIDEAALRSLHEAKREARSDMRQALQDGDYEAFVEAVADSPLADVITSESDFEQFREAHELRQNGDVEEAQEIFDELGIEPKPKKHHGKGRILSELSDDQREAFKVAKQANDRATMQAILDEAGIELPDRR